MILQYFTDPVLRAPTIGSMLMCFVASLIGVVVVIRRRSLLGETLSHASYPGVVISALVAGSFFPNSEEGLACAVLIGALLFALLGLFCLHKLQTRFKVQSDAALCFVLSVFLGVGVLIASRIQITHALWYRQIQIYLYGQVATMTDVHIWIYSALSFLVLLVFILLYRDIEMINFDRDFSKSVGIRVSFIDGILYLLLGLAIVIGIRSVGVVLMSGMLIAPAVAARQFSHRLHLVFFLAGIFGALSGFLGNYLSVEIPQMLNDKFSLPTGPMIVLSASFLCFTALLIAPGRGLFNRTIAAAFFRDHCQLENILKTFWKKGEESVLSLKEIAVLQGGSPCGIWMRLTRLTFQGWLEGTGWGSYRLTRDGKKRARRIVRLHRLWEVYLVYLGRGVDKVHHSAEEMEHIITPELEKELTDLLQDPKSDPHAQPIPSKDKLP
ncbi:MAG: iron chelate uptake ABC transporter family permease subunit [Chlamydiota bacterium]